MKITKPDIRYAGGILGTPIIVVNDKRVEKEHVEEMISALMYIKNNADFYTSAIEMNHNADGEKAEELINKVLEKMGVEI